MPGGLLPDITLDAASFAALDRPVARVFITENEINFLAFPPLKNSLLIFGAGYGFEMLRPAQWLARCRIHYWGDIDTHAFATLWGEEEKPTQRDLPRLTAPESALYDDLRDNRIRKNLRLEQERIGFGWVEAALKVVMAGAE